MLALVKCKHILCFNDACIGGKAVSEKPSGKAKGGVARSEALSPDQRKEIARKAAETRWSNSPGQAERAPPPNYRKAICPLREGDITFFFPNELSAVSANAAVTYFSMVMNQIRAQGAERDDDGTK
jgi:hypothetical protein